MYWNYIFLFHIAFSIALAILCYILSQISYDYGDKLFGRINLFLMCVNLAVAHAAVILMVLRL